MRLHRRRVLTGIGAALSASVMPAPYARAALPPFRRKVGAIEVMVVSDGVLNVPLSFLFQKRREQKRRRYFLRLAFRQMGRSGKSMSRW